MVGFYQSEQMSTPEEKSDYHYTLRGSYRVAPDRLYDLVMYNIQKNGFLRILEANKTNRVLKITSDRKEDPRGAIEFGIRELGPNISHFRMRIEDEEFLAAVRADGLQARYGKGCKHRDSIGGILIQKAAGENDRRVFEMSLRGYVGMKEYVPKLLQGLTGIMAPAGREIMKMTELADKYMHIFPPERAATIADEIQDLRYAYYARQFSIDSNKGKNNHGRRTSPVQESLTMADCALAGTSFRLDARS